MRWVCFVFQKSLRSIITMTFSYRSNGMEKYDESDLNGLEPNGIKSVAILVSIKIYMEGIPRVYYYLSGINDKLKHTATEAMTHSGHATKFRNKDQTDDSMILIHRQWWEQWIARYKISHLLRNLIGKFK